MLQEIEELTDQVDHMTRRVEHILNTRGAAVDGEPGSSAGREFRIVGSCGWGERRELGR